MDKEVIANQQGHWSLLLYTGKSHAFIAFASILLHALKTPNNILDKHQ